MTKGKPMTTSAADLHEGSRVDLEGLINIKEAASRSGYSESTLRRYQDKGTLTLYANVSGRRMFDPDELDRTFKTAIVRVVDTKSAE